jgi:hypothetical protein
MKVLTCLAICIVLFGCSQHYENVSDTVMEYAVPVAPGLYKVDAQIWFSPVGNQKIKDTVNPAHIMPENRCIK